MQIHYYLASDTQNKVTMDCYVSPIHTGPCVDVLCVIPTHGPSRQNLHHINTLGKDLCEVGLKEQPLTRDPQQANPTPGRLNNTMPFKKITVFQMN